MEHKLKTISSAGIAEAISKVELYRYLNEPEEAESICLDILAVGPDHQLALRLLGLCITDQFTGHASDRYAEAEGHFRKLTDRYEQLYYMGLLYKRRAKAQFRTGCPPHALLVLFEAAMHCFEEAEKIRPEGNDDSILHWNRCARLLQSKSEREWQRETPETWDHGDSPPV